MLALTCQKHNEKGNLSTRKACHSCAKLFIIQCIQNKFHLLLFSIYKICREHVKYP